MICRDAALLSAVQPLRQRRTRARRLQLRRGPVRIQVPPIGRRSNTIAITPFRQKIPLVLHTPLAENEVFLYYLRPTPLQVHFAIPHNENVLKKRLDLKEAIEAIPSMREPCIFQGEFPYALFFGTLGGCTLALSALLWATQRRHVKTHRA